MTSSVTYWCYIFIVISSFNAVILTTVPEVIHKRGYTCEEHHVTTEDGYILTLFRIPSGQGVNRSNSSSPVIMFHGLLSSSFSWVLSTPHKSPAFLLADAGYDVWLPNARGSTYSRNHTYFPINSSEFWNFSWDEMAEFDFPAVIDYVLKATKHSKVFYIGHSMGTTIFFSGMNYHPEYNLKIQSMYGLGPVATVAHIESEFRVFSYVQAIIKHGMNLLGMHEFLPEDSYIMSLTRIGCKYFRVTKYVCSNILFLIAGLDNREFNSDWLPIVTNELLSGTSINTVIHFGQEYRSGLYQRFDFGYYENLRKYKQGFPPKYNLSYVSSVTNLFWGANDYLADPLDVKFLLANLPNIGITCQVSDPDFNHGDFIWAPEAKTHVYDKIINDMNKFSSEV